MKRLTNRVLVGVAAACVLYVATGWSYAGVVNLNDTATGFGLTPVIGLNQGSAAGIADGTMYSWVITIAASPRNWSGATNIQPWITWPSDQQIRTVRVWEDRDAGGGSYDRLRIDRLDTGGSTAVEGAGGWLNVYDSGTGQSIQFSDVDLGATYTTRGLRVRVDKTTTDVNVGEVAVFGPLPLGGTLTSLRVFPTNVVASGVEYGGAAGANNVNWFDRWQVGATVNPDPDFWYDMFFANAKLDAVSLTFAQQGVHGAVPTSWELLADTGSGLTSLGTFSRTTAQNGQIDGVYYINIGSLSGVNQIRLRVPEANTGGNGLALMEFEAFQTEPIPEPGTVGLLALGAGLALFRRRRT